MTTDGRSQWRKQGRELLMPTQALIMQFRIELQDTKPLIWRTIEVPGTFTFWDLHVAIQDAMGWQDAHLHRFTMSHPKSKRECVFGIHNLAQDCDDPPGWAHQIASMFTLTNTEARYEYDFGGDWRHTIRLMSLAKRDFTQRYPRCTAGERACPPEDCGGVHGFSEIVAAIAQGTLDAGMRRWLPKGYDPARFDPKKVLFSDPAQRLAYSWYGFEEDSDA